MATIKDLPVLIVESEDEQKTEIDEMEYSKYELQIV